MNPTTLERQAALASLIVRRSPSPAQRICAPRGGVLTEVFGDYDPRPSVYVRTLNGTGISLLDRNEAESILATLRRQNSALFTVHGGIRLHEDGCEGEQSGFSWREIGRLPVRRHVIRPLRVTGVSLSQPVAIGIELIGDGVLCATSGLFPNLATAELAASCLWSSLIGRGAARADLILPDYRRQPVAQVTQACGLVDRALIEALTASMTGTAGPGHTTHDDT